MSSVDTGPTTSLWLVEFENYDYPLRVTDQDIFSIMNMFGVQNAADLMPKQTPKPELEPKTHVFGMPMTNPRGSPVPDIIVPSTEYASKHVGTKAHHNRQVGTRFTAHARHISNFGVSASDAVFYIVRDEHDQWQKAMLKDITAGGKSCTIVDQGAGFNPKVDTKATEDAIKAHGIFTEEELDIKGVISLKRGDSYTLTVIFDINNPKKKTAAQESRDKIKYVQSHREGLVNGARKEIGYQVEEYFRQSVTNFVKLVKPNRVLHDAVVQFATEAPGKDERAWAALQKMPKTSQRYRSLSPGEDKTAELLDRLNRVESKVDQLLRVSINHEKVVF
jgi:hypothetical protein